MSFEKDGIVQVGPEELMEIYNSGEKEPIIIDVREPEEYEQGHIPGVPLIPMNTIPEHVEKLKQERSYIFVCRSGGRSQKVSLFLKEKGFDNVRNYAGGMLEWTGELKHGLEWVVTDASELGEK